MTEILSSSYVRFASDWGDYILGVPAIIICIFLFYKFYSKKTSFLPDENFDSSDENTIFSKLKIALVGQNFSMTNQHFVFCFITLTNKHIYFLLDHETTTKKGKVEKKDITKYQTTDWQRIKLSEISAKINKIWINRFVEISHPQLEPSLRIWKPLYLYPDNKKLYNYLIENFTG